MRLACVPLSKLLLPVSLIPSFVLGIALCAHAQEPVGLRYEAPPGCPTQPDFVTAVTERGGQFTSKGKGDGARTLTVSIRQQGSAFTGSLQVKRLDSASGAREVQGATCQEVVDALAVVAAIELREAQDAAPVAVPQPKREASSAVVAAPTSKRVEGFTGRSTWGRDEVPVTAGTLQLKPLLSFRLSGGVQLGPIPGLVLPRYDGVFRFANVVTTPDGQQRLNGPILQARLILLGPPFPSFQSGDTKVLFGSGIALGLGACWSPHYNTRGLVLLGCGEFSYGQAGFTTQDSNGTRLPTGVVGFGSVGPAIEVEYNLGNHFHVGFQAGVDVMIQATVRRDDGSRIFDTNWWSVHGTLGLGMHF